MLKLLEGIQYISERLSTFAHSFPITTSRLTAVVQNPANSSYTDILFMPKEAALCASTFLFFVLLWVLQKKQLTYKFPIYRKITYFNWQFYNIIFGIILSYFTAIIAINIFRNPTPELPFRTFQELKTLVDQNKIALIARNGAAFAMLNGTVPENKITCSSNATEALEIVKRDRNKAYFESPSWISSLMTSLNCELITISDSSFPGQHAGILYSKSAPKWFRNLPLPTVIALRTIVEKYNRKYQHNKIDYSCKENPIRPLKIQQIFSSFYLLLGGFVVTALVFAFELLLGRKKRMLPTVPSNTDTTLNRSQRQEPKYRNQSSQTENLCDCQLCAITQ